jgi:hypothetical protein
MEIHAVVYHVALPFKRDYSIIRFSSEAELRTGLGPLHAQLSGPRGSMIYVREVKRSYKCPVGIIAADIWRLMRARANLSPGPG